MNGIYGIIVLAVAILITGMVAPFWAVMGSAAAMVLTMVLNPILFNWGVLTRWKPGMDTISTTFSNSIDFWMSFGFGVAGAIAVIGFYQTIRDVVLKVREARARGNAQVDRSKPRENIWDTPPGRGDFSLWIALGLYAFCGALVVWICHLLVPKFPVLFLIFFVYFYTPLISYINARLIGICGHPKECGGFHICGQLVIYDHTVFHAIVNRHDHRVARVWGIDVGFQSTDPLAFSGDLHDTHFFQSSHTRFSA